MGDDELAVYGDWEVARPGIPPRSRLFHLEPVGIGSSETESLTSYVGRLAEAHSVRVRELVKHEILPLLGRPHLAEDPKGSLLSAFWRNETRALNGTRRLARNLVAALETLTGRHDLRFLTLLTWAEVLPVQQLQRRTRAWCPACYDEWKQTDRVIYEPLLWSLAPVTVCPHHRRRLRMVCPHPDCQRPSPWLSARSRPGCCARCGRWLGDRGDPGAGAGESLAEEEIRVQAWIVQAVGELIAAAPDLAAPPQHEQVTCAVLDSVDALAGGNRRAWARTLGLGMETVMNWCQGGTRPSLWLLLDLCGRLGATPLRWLSPESAAAPATPGDGFPRGVSVLRPPWVHTAIDQVAVRGALETILASEEAPPPSLREVAERLGQTYANLRHHCPDLCQEISARFLRHQAAQGAQTRQQLRDEVRQAAWEVHRQGRYPSAHRIAPLLNCPGSIRSRPARAAWQEALRELGWRP
jgi:hypothetical protein